MLEDALVIVIYISLIVLIITFIVVGIRLIESLKKMDKLVENVTDKAESLNGVFNMIDYTSSKFGAIGEAIANYLMGVVNKLLRKLKKEREEKENE